MKTKDIMKILKLVKKAKKHKKRKRHHSKKKVIVTPTQNIQPSTLQPYEISRQVPMTNTNNLGLDNLRLSNILLENKMKEGNDTNDKINDINNKLVTYDNKLVTYDNNNQAFNNMIVDVNTKLLTYDNDNKTLANQYNDVNNRLIAYDPNLNATRFNDVDRDILEVKNKNKNADDRLNNFINAGNAFMNETKRNFEDQKLLNHQLNRFDEVDERFDMFNPLLIKHKDLYDIPGSAEKKKEEVEEEKEQSNTPNSSIPSIPDNTIFEEEKSSKPPPEKKAKKKKDSKLPPPPDIQQQPGTLSTAEKKHNMKIDEIINKIQNDDNNEVLDTKSKVIYFNLYKKGKIHYPNSSKTKSSIIDNLLKKKF